MLREACLLLRPVPPRPAFRPVPFSIPCSHSMSTLYAVSATPAFRGTPLRQCPLRTVPSALSPRVVLYVSPGIILSHAPFRIPACILPLDRFMPSETYASPALPLHRPTSSISFHDVPFWVSLCPISFCPIYVCPISFCPIFLCSISFHYPFFF